MHAVVVCSSSSSSSSSSWKPGDSVLDRITGKAFKPYEPTSVNLKHVCLTLWFHHIKTPQRTEMRIDKLLLWQINDTQVFRENNGMNS